MDLELYNKGMPAIIPQGMNQAEALVLEKSSGRKISETMDTELVKQIEGSLPFIFHDIGIHSKPTAYEYSRLMQVLKTYFGDICFAEVKLAFELLITGKLDRYLPADRAGKAEKNHFQLFSMEYVMRVLNAYKAARASVKDKAVILSLPVYTPTPAEIRIEYLRLLDDELENYRTTGEVLFVYPITAVEVLQELGLFTGTFEASDADRLEGLQIADTIGTRVDPETVMFYGRGQRAKEIIKETFASLPADFKFLP